MSIEIFKYNGNNITFQLGNGDVMVNATEMAKPFNKRPSKYLELPSTIEFIERLKAVRKSDSLINSVNGVGTWMHEDIALDFAQWLSVDFKIWCNDRLKELLRTGRTEITPKNPLELLKLAVAEMEKKEKEIKLLRPKAELADRVIDTDNNIDIGQAAKLLNLGFGRNTLFTKLRERGVFFKNKNEPKQDFINRGYFLLKERLINPTGHKEFSVIKVLVTQKGLEYISKLFPVEKVNKQQALIQ